MLYWVNRRLPNVRLEFSQGLGRVPHDEREYSLRPAAGAASVIDCGPVSLQWSNGMWRYPLTVPMPIAHPRWGDRGIVPSACERRAKYYERNRTQARTRANAKISRTEAGTRPEISSDARISRTAMETGTNS